MRGSEEILVHRAMGRGRFGTVVASVGAPRAVKGCAIWPRSTTEADTLREDTTVVLVSLFVPVGTDLLPTDEVEARGHRWTVEGDAEEYVMRGRARGRIFGLRRAA
jgi:hypothetical protein